MGLLHEYSYTSHVLRIGNRGIKPAHEHLLSLDEIMDIVGKHPDVIPILMEHGASMYPGKK